MANSSINPDSIVQRLVRELTRDKKKTVMLCVSLLVAIVLVGKQLIPGDTPQTAQADEIEIVDDASQDFKPFGNADAPAKRKRAEIQRQKIVRDVFATDLEAFPLLNGDAIPSVVTGVSDSTGKSSSLNKLIRAQARALSLQTTMVSANPVAMINGRMLRIGEWINGFELTEITPRGCSVRKNGVTVMLEMSN